MIRSRTIALATLTATLALGLPHAGNSNEFAPQLEDLFNDDLQAWLQEPRLVEAVKRSNEAQGDLTEAEIAELDQQWRDEVATGGGALTDEVMARPLSEWLQGQQAALDGLITEVFVMNDKGLNVGQSALTSDYMQGDEAKWQETYGEGAAALFIDEVEFDESTGAFQTQVSATVIDPATNEAIGAITFGVDLDRLLSS